MGGYLLEELFFVLLHFTYLFLLLQRGCKSAGQDGVTAVHEGIVSLENRLLIQVGL